MTTPLSARDLIDRTEALTGNQPPVRLAVFGDPITHTRSPGFQNAALRACNIDASYAAVHVRPEELEAALRSLPAAGFLGVNLTLPHKTAALSIVDHLDESASLLSAINAITVGDDGSLTGFNTDAPGFVRAIREEFFTDVRDLRILVLGAGGGAGRAIATQCAIEGCERLVLANRTVEKARDLGAQLAGYFKSDRLLGPTDRLTAIGCTPAELRAQLEYTDLVVNASSLGMKRSDPPAIPQNLLTANLMVYDAVYAGGMTRLVEDARQAGCRAANGLSMLLHQGAIAFELWFDRSAPLDVMRAALQAG